MSTDESSDLPPPEQGKTPPANDRIRVSWYLTRSGSPLLAEWMERNPRNWPGYLRLVLEKLLREGAIPADLTDLPLLAKPASGDKRPGAAEEQPQAAPAEPQAAQQPQAAPAEPVRPPPPKTDPVPDAVKDASERMRQIALKSLMSNNT